MLWEHIRVFFLVLITLVANAKLGCNSARRTPSKERAAVNGPLETACCRPVCYNSVEFAGDERWQPQPLHRPRQYPASIPSPSPLPVRLLERSRKSWHSRTRFPRDCAWGWLGEAARASNTPCRLRTAPA